MFGKETHIVPIAEGTEDERVVAPIREQTPDVVHLLYDRTIGATVNKMIEAKLRDLGPEIDQTPYEVTADTPEIFSVFGLVTTIASQYDDNSDVYVNVSAGNKRAAIGATLGCMDDGTDATAYFVDADGAISEDGHGGDVSAGLASGGFTTSEVPDYHIDSPSRDEVAVLAMLASRNTELSPAKKRTIIDRGLEISSEVEDTLEYVKRIQTSETGDNVSDRNNVNDLDSISDLDSPQGAYNHVRPVLNSLESKEYIELNELGRSTAVELTDRGDRTLRAFRHEVTDVIAALDDHAQPDWLTEGV